jgi:hypothetical protein
MAVNSRATLIDYCKRKLGEPVIEVNVDDDQVDDRLDDALQMYHDYHSDGTLRTYLKHLVTQTDVDNEYITLNADINYVSKLFPLTSTMANSRNFFDIKYQIMLNDMHNLAGFLGDLAYYEQMQQYMSLLDMKLNGMPQVQFSRRQNRLYIFGDFADQDIKVGDYIIAEVYRNIDATTYGSVWNDKWVKAYATALIKQQWGSNLLKFEGMQLPGGVSLNARQIYDDATTEIESLKESLRLEAEFPPDFYVG